MKAFLKTYTKVWLIVVVAISLQNCAISDDVATNRLIQKRKYNKGWHVSKFERKADLTKKVEEKDHYVSNDIKETGVTAFKNEFSFSNSDQKDITTSFLSPVKTERKTILKSVLKNKYASIDEECDLIVLIDGEEISAKILEVSNTEINYKRCDNLDGPLFTMLTSEIFMVKYKNGTKKVYKGAPSAYEEPTVETNNTTTNTNSTNKQLNEEDYIATTSSDDKSFLIAVLLWFFLGLIGFHRFYLGHIGIGILYLLTGGLCGIGWLVDGILFLTGGLQPKRGKYIDA